MNEKGEQFYEFVKAQGINVPNSYDEFKTAMQDANTASQFHAFVIDKNISVPESVEEFQSTFSDGGADVNFTEGSVEQQEQPTEPLEKDITIEDGTIKTPEMDFNAQALLDKKLSEKYSGPKLTFSEAEPFVEEPIDISIPEKKDIVKGKIYTPSQLISDREAEILELDEKIKTLPQPQVGRMAGYPTKQEIYAYEERKELIKLKNQKEKQLADLKNSNDDILSAESGSSYFLDGKELTRSQLRNFATGMEFTTGLESGDKDFDIKVENDEQMDDFLLSQKEAADVGFFEKSARGFAATTKDILIDGIDVRFAESQQLLADIGLIDEEAAAMTTVLGSFQPESANKAFALAKIEVERDPREKKDFGDAFLRNYSAQIQNTNEELRGKQLERSYDVIDLLEAGEIGAASKEVAKMSVESLPYTFVAMTGWGGAALIANSVQAREYYDLRNQGVSKEKALISSGLASLIETADAALEGKIFKSNISKARNITNQTGMAAGYTKQQLKDLSKNVFSSYVKEMPTELAQGTLGELNRQWATDKPIDFESATRAGVIESLAAAPTSTIISSPAMAKLVYAPVKRYKDLSKIQNTIGDFLFRSAETTDNTERKILLDQSKMLVNDFIAESNKIEQTAKKATEEESNTLKDLTLQEFTLERTLENTDNLSPETVEVLQSKLDDIGKQKSELINNIDSREDVAVEDVAAIEEVIEEQEYTKFVDEGVVSEERIQDIADKVRQQQELTPREQEIFTDKTSEVNQKIAEFAPIEEAAPVTEAVEEVFEDTPNKIYHNSLTTKALEQGVLLLPSVSKTARTEQDDDAVFFTEEPDWDGRGMRSAKLIFNKDGIKPSLRKGKRYKEEKELLSDENVDLSKEGGLIGIELPTSPQSYGSVIASVDFSNEAEKAGLDEDSYVKKLMQEEHNKEFEKTKQKAQELANKYQVPVKIIPPSGIDGKSEIIKPVEETAPVEEAVEEAPIVTDDAGKAITVYRGGKPASGVQYYTSDEKLAEGIGEAKGEGVQKATVRMANPWTPESLDVNNAPQWMKDWVRSQEEFTTVDEETMAAEEIPMEQAIQEIKDMRLSFRDVGLWQSFVNETLKHHDGIIAFDPSEDMATDKKIYITKSPEQVVTEDITEDKKELTNAEKTKIAEEIGKVRKVKPKNIKGLLDVMGGIFGLNKKQAESASVVGDVIIGNMAKRAGISKDEMYQKIAYQKAQKAPDGSLKQMISEDADGNVIFESSVKRGLSELPNNPMTPDAWVAQISKKGGRGTQEELYVIGVLDKNSDGNYVVSQNFKDAIGWIGDKKVDLKDQKAIDGKYWKSVPKEVVEKYINDNQIEIVEVTKGGSEKESFDKLFTYEDKGDTFYFNHREQGMGDPPAYEAFEEDGLWNVTSEFSGESLGDFNSKQEAIDAIKTSYENLDEGFTTEANTKYSQYTLEGGENYREVLLTLPQEKPASSYKSSHWDETNIVAHLRINERTLPNGERVMFIEEVQSDWAQEGKKKGFASDLFEGNFRAFVEQEKGLRLNEEELLAEFNNNEGTLKKEFLERTDRTKTPDMPYKKTDQWVGMAMRRAMQMAAQEGFDRVAWVTGEQSADRYDLSKQVDEIRYLKEGDLYVLDIVKGNQNQQTLELNENQLEATVGKEIAEKIINKEGNPFIYDNIETRYKTLSGFELDTVGGEGMKTFYNSILPKVAKKEAQRFDKKAKVEVVDFRKQEGFVMPTSKPNSPSKQLSIPITSEMRMNLNSAVPLFQGEQGAMTAADGNYVVYALTNPNVSTPLHELAHVYEHYLTDDEIAVIERWGGHKAGTVEFSEKFARGFEKFLAGGKVKNPRLQKIFENFKKWLTEIYNGIKGSEIDIQLNDKMEAIYNDMLGVEETSVEQTKDVNAEVRTLNDNFVEDEKGFFGKKRRPIGDIVSFAKKNNISEEALTIFLKDKKYSEKQIESAISTLNQEIDMSAKVVTWLPDFANKALEKAYEQIGDKYYRLLKLQKQTSAKTNRILSEEVDAYLATELETSKIAESINKFKNRIIKSKRKQDPALIERMSKDNISVESLGLYMYAMHATERNEFLKQRAIDEGREGNLEGLSGMTNEQAQEILDSIPENTKEKLEEYASEFRKEVIIKRVDNLKDSGLISDETADRLKNTYKYYVPLKVEEFESTKTATTTPRKIGVKGNVIWKAKGSNFFDAQSRRNPVIESINAYIQDDIKAERNRTFQTLMGLTREIDDKNILEIYRPRYQEMTDGLGNKVFIPLHKEPPNQSISGNVDGKVVYIIAKDKDLFKSLNNVPQGNYSTAVKVLQGVNSYLRNVNTLLNPEFIATNFARDIQTALINISAEDARKMSLQMIKNIPNAAKGIFQNEKGVESKWSKIYQELKDNGGDISWLDINSVDKIQKEVVKAEKAYRKNPTQSKLKDLMMIMGGFFTSTIKASEMATRLAAYQAAIENNYPPKKAASLAKNLTVNFEKKGFAGNIINTFYLFANAGLQGSFRIFKALGKKGRGGNRARAIVTGIIATSFLNAMLNELNDDEDELELLTDSDRDRKMVWKLSDGGSITIPLPYGYNVFWALGQNMYRYVSEKTNASQFMAATISSVNGAFNPFSSAIDDDAGAALIQSITPTAVKPIVEIGMNKNWNAAPIKPEQPPFGPKKKESELYFSTVRKPSRKVTEFLSELGVAEISPEIIDYTVDFVGGGLGRFITNSGELIYDVATGEDVPEYRIPFYRQFYMKPNERNIIPFIYEINANREIQDFTEREEKLYKKYLLKAFKDGLIDNSKYNRMRSDFDEAKYKRKAAKKDSFFD